MGLWGADHHTAPCHGNTAEFDSHERVASIMQIDNTAAATSGCGGSLRSCPRVRSRWYLSYTRVPTAAAVLQHSRTAGEHGAAAPSTLRGPASFEPRAPGLAAQSAEVARNPVELIDYVHILRRRWVLIALVMIACVGGAAVATKLTTPTYQATSRLIVNGSRVCGPTRSSRTSWQHLRATSFAQIIPTAPAVQAALNEAENESRALQSFGVSVRQRLGRRHRSLHLHHRHRHRPTPGPSGRERIRGRAPKCPQAAAAARRRRPTRST